MLNKSNVRFRGKDIDNLTIEELRIALMQALNRVAELEAAQPSVMADELCPNCGRNYFVEQTIVDGELRCSCARL